MKFTRKFIIAAFCLGTAGTIFADTQKSFVSQESSDIPTQPMLEAESGTQESNSEQNSDWLEAHESNGPEGTHGVPMQKMTHFQLGLVLLILAASGSLTVVTKTNSPTNHEQK